MNATRKTYEAPALSVSGKFVVETRKNVFGALETVDAQPQYGPDSVGFGL
jgi:hypothetical protein